MKKQCKQWTQILQHSSAYLHNLSTQFDANPFQVIQFLQPGEIFLGKYRIICPAELLENTDSQYKNKYKRAKLEVQPVFTQEEDMTYELVYVSGFTLDTCYVTNFFREVVLLKHLDEEQPLEFGQIPGNIIYKLYRPVTEQFITLESFLQQKLKQRPKNNNRSFQPLLSEEQTVSLGLRLLSLLDNLHQRNVLHLNFSPSSIHLKNGLLEEPVLRDLEMCIWNPEDILGEHNPYFIQDTRDKLDITYRNKDYMSPEHLFTCNQKQITDTQFFQHVGVQSDLYSLGCILFRCITGQPPGNFSKDTAEHIIHQTRVIPLQPYELPAVFEGLVMSNSMSTLLIKLLAENKKLRYKSSLELRSDLMALQQSLHETPKLLFQALEFVESTTNWTAPGVNVDFREYRLIDFALEYLYKYIYESNIQYLSIFGGQLPISVLKNNTIEDLNLANKGLYAEDFIALFHILPYNSSLKSINFSNNFLAFRHSDIERSQVHKYYETCINYFISALEEHTKLTSFDISRNDVGPENCCKICIPLAKNTQLEYINLTSCKIGPQGCIQICQILQPFKSIKWIYLSNNMIEDEGAIRVAELLKNNHAILELDLFNNGIQHAGGKAIGSSLTTNFIIQKLSIGENEIHQNEIDLIQQSVVFNIQYAKMKATNERFGDFGHNLMAESLKRWVQSSKFVEDKLKARLIQCEDAIDRKMAEILLDKDGNLDLTPANYKDNP